MISSKVGMYYLRFRCWYWMDFCKPYVYIIYDQKHITRETDLRHLFSIIGGGQECLEGCCLYAEKQEEESLAAGELERFRPEGMHADLEHPRSGHRQWSATQHCSLPACRHASRDTSDPSIKGQLAGHWHDAFSKVHKGLAAQKITSYSCLKFHH